MYDITDGGRGLRQHNVCGLAWWHTYKHCAIEVWRKFANMLFAPLAHNLYPNGRFFLEGSSLVMIVMHFMYVWIAYAGFKQLLEQTLARDDLNDANRTALQDLQFLCEFAIPAVRVHSQHISFVFDLCLFRPTNAETH